MRDNSVAYQHSSMWVDDEKLEYCSIILNSVQVELSRTIYR